MSPGVRSVLAREILRYEREVWKEDMRDPIRPPVWRTPRGRFYRQCAQAWRDFALAIERAEAPPVTLWPCARHHFVGCTPCFKIWLRFHPEGVTITQGPI